MPGAIWWDGQRNRPITPAPSQTRRTCRSNSRQSAERRHLAALLAGGGHRLKGRRVGALICNDKPAPASVHRAGIVERYTKSICWGKGAPILAFNSSPGLAVPAGPIYRMDEVTLDEGVDRAGAVLLRTFSGEDGTLIPLRSGLGYPDDGEPGAA